jgi:hypothetical protein
MDPVGDSLDEAAQEVRGRVARHLLVQFDEGEFGGPVDRDDEIEPALSGSNLGDVDMELADRIGLELALRRGFAFDPEAERSRGAAGIGEGRSASDAEWWAAGHKGSRRAAAKYAFGKRRPQPLPRG